jgi:FkbM family methyltransferase
MKNLFLLFYNFIDDYFHSKKIFEYLKKNVFLKKGIIFDIGAHNGKIAKNFSLLYNDSKIYCFEPNKKMFNKIKDLKNKNLIIKNLAAGDKNKKILLNINILDLTTSLKKLNKNSLYLKLKKLIIGQSKKDYSQKIKVVMLDTFCKKAKIKQIDLMKIDCEGYEYQVLCGASKIIKKTKYIIIEIQKNDMYQNYSEKKIESFLEKNNFKMIRNFSFPFMFFQDRIYKNMKINSEYYQ